MKCDPNHSPSKDILKRRRYASATLAGLGATAALLLSGSTEQVDTPKCHITYPSPQKDPVVQAILSKIASHKPVRYDANRGIICNSQLTTVPIMISEGGKTQWFTLDASGSNLRVGRINNPTAFNEQQFGSEPAIHVASHEGIIDTETRTGIPAVNVIMQDGVSRYTAVAQTAPIAQ